MNMFWEELDPLPDSPGVSALRPNRRLLVGSMRCADGEYLGVHTGANGSYGRLIEAMGLSDRVSPAPGTGEKTVPLTDAECEVVSREVPRLFASRPRDEWRERLRAH